MLGVVVAGLLAPGSAWGQWEEVAKLTASDPAPHDLFGHSVALDGDTAVIGAASDDHAGGTDAGSAYVFGRPAGAETHCPRQYGAPATHATTATLGVQFGNQKAEGRRQKAEGAESG